MLVNFNAAGTICFIAVVVKEVKGCCSVSFRVPANGHGKSRSREDAVDGAGTKAYCNKLSAGQWQDNFSAKKQSNAWKKVRLLGQWLEKGGSRSWWQYKGVIWHSSVTTAPLRLLFIGPDGISKGRDVFSCNISSAITTEPCVCSLSSSCKASLTLENP